MVDVRTYSKEKHSRTDVIQLVHDEIMGQGFSLLGVISAEEGNDVTTYVMKDDEAVYFARFTMKQTELGNHEVHIAQFRVRRDELTLLQQTGWV